MKKYSGIKEWVNFDVIKKIDEDLAYLTYYLHHNKKDLYCNP